MEGTVKFFNRKKGFGFVSGEDGKDYFIHFSALKMPGFLRDNDKVSFDPAEGERGLKAENVELLQKGSERDDLPAEETPAEEPAPAEEEAPAEETPAEEPAPAEEEAPAEETPAEEPAPAEEPKTE